MENLTIQSQALSSPYVLEQISKIDNICSDYGLYGTIINYKNDASVLGSGLYIVIGVDPIDDENVKPYKIANRIVRDPDLFYPKEFAIQLTSENAMVVLDQVMEFCQNAEFLSHLYAEYNTELPECIRYSELTGLKNWCDGRVNKNANEKFRNECKKGLKIFFKNENSSFGQEKRKFFRSERYDENAGFLQRQSDFANRNSSIVRLDVLLQSSKEIAKKKVSKGELNSFVQYMQKVFPEVLFSVSEKEIVDSGLIELSKNLPEDHPFLQKKPVTDDEFDKVIKERFATEGFDCVKDLKPAYWEFYDIYYKKVDEPQIIAAYNDIYLAFADHEPLQTIKARGPMNRIDLPVDDFHYFVALAKSKNLQFHIDHYGKFSVPSFTDIHVIYSSWDQKIMNEILDEMVSNNILNSHIVSSHKISESLNSKIGKAQEVQALNGTAEYQGNRENERS